MFVIYNYLHCVSFSSLLYSTDRKDNYLRVRKRCCLGEMVFLKFMSFFNSSGDNSAKSLSNLFMLIQYILKNLLGKCLRSGYRV